MKNILNCVCAEKWADVGPLVLRIALGAIFVMHGWLKLTTMGVAGTAGFLGMIGFPIPTVFAMILIALELGGGIALILGVYTHWTAKLLIVEMLVALIFVHFAKGFFADKGGFEFVMLIIAGCVAVMISGAGKYSLDHTLGHGKKK